MWFSKDPKILKVPKPEDTLPGRSEPAPAPEQHFINNVRLEPPFPDITEHAVFGMGCFWGTEKQFWELPGVYLTAVGYAGGTTQNPTYQEVCSGQTGHTEVALVVFYPAQVSYERLLKMFWENHNPTQGMRQGNDIGTQYRSAIYTASEAQHQAAWMSRDAYQSVLTQANYGKISTEILPAGPFYYAEAYHQQYLAKNPLGYCGPGGTGVSCPVGLVVDG